MDGHIWWSCRTGANNVVTTARTIHLPEQKEMIHVISMFRKEACSGSIHDFAHIPTQNCLADCLTKASANSDNLITAVKTGRLLDVEIHPNFRKLIGTKGFLFYMVRNIHGHNGEWCFLPKCFRRYLSHRLYKKDHSIRCLWENNRVKNQRNQRCATGTTCY